MFRLGERVRKRGTRGAVSLLSYALSLIVNFYTSRHLYPAFGTAILAILITVYLFWPDIKRLQIVHPKNYPAMIESPVWLYIFGLSALLLVGLAWYRIYDTSTRLPMPVSAAEFSEPYIRGKFVRIMDFADPQNAIKGRTFEDTYIYGPATLYAYRDVQIVHSGFTGTAESALVVAKGAFNPEGGVLVLDDVRFIRCHFVKITILGGDERQIDEWRRDLIAGSSK